MILFKNDTGISHDTKILNAETGESLSKILAVEYGVKIEIGKDTVSADARIAMMCIDIAPEKVKFLTMHPVSGKYEAVAAIEFRDGARVEIAEDGTPSVAQPPRSEGMGSD
jgi:hypothetical protein